ncbi:MAG: cytochrome-c oxidase, cbb3-type subunit III, partial [Rickettsiales bacterium]
HGTGGAGSAGYPNLNDDDWLWGGKPETIYQTIRYGIRSEHDEAHASEMPAFGDMLSAAEIQQIADYVLSLSHKGEGSETGVQLFADNCASCHGADGRGDREFGAPNLADAIWFYGDTKGDIAAQIRKPKHGVMPHWVDRLDDATIRQLTIYVHSLGGGE